MKELTKAEEEVMQHLWQLEQASVKEILAQIPQPRPAYNTVSTIIRILEQKGMVGHRAQGRGYRYHPLITRETYRRFSVSKMLKGYFNGSARELVSFFVQDEKLSTAELDEILALIEKERRP